jgi:hypothetical protein
MSAPQGQPTPTYMHIIGRYVKRRLFPLPPGEREARVISRGDPHPIPLSTPLREVTLPCAEGERLRGVLLEVRVPYSAAIAPYMAGL